jgi:two-component sensor histidine kinase
MKIDKRKKIILISAILLVSVLPVFWLPLDKKCEYIYTHIFYIPVIIAAFWFHFHAFWIVGFYSIAMIFYFQNSGFTGFLQVVYSQVIISSALVLLVILLKKNRDKSYWKILNQDKKGFPLEENICEDPDNSIEDQREQILREVYHRVKNNMQIITSLISLQIVKENNEDVKSALVECHNRVKAMSLIHEKLYSSDSDNSIEMRGYVESLVSSLMRAYRIDKDKINVVIDMEPHCLNLDRSIPLSQIISEILSNSLRHGFLSGDNGKVVIKFYADNLEEGLFVLCIRDNGKGLPPHVSYPDKGKLGFNLIQGLARQMGGDMKTDFSGGTSFEFIFPVK